MADNAVEAGLYEVWQRLTTGRLSLPGCARTCFRSTGCTAATKEGASQGRTISEWDAKRYSLMTMNES